MFELYNESVASCPAFLEVAPVSRREFQKPCITLGGRAPRDEKKGRTLCEPLVNDCGFEEILDRDFPTVSLAANGPSLTMSQIN